MKPRPLPTGPWEALFPRALTLLDDIGRHGGIAKKMYHRGDRVTARDLFDLALVIEREPLDLLRRHRSCCATGTPRSMPSRHWTARRTSSIARPRPENS